YLRKDEKMPDVALVSRLVGRWIEATNHALVVADDAHTKELADDAAPREARDTSVEKVREVLLDLRAAADTAYGAAGLRKLALAEAVATDPAAVAAQARQARDALADDEVKLPKPRRAGIKLDRAAFAAELDAELPPLKKALDAVAREAREAEA